jgi:hypothetical protein
MKLKTKPDSLDLFDCWHPFWMWEEVQHNMWGNVTDKGEWLMFYMDHGCARLPRRGIIRARTT